MERSTLECAAAVMATALMAIALHGCATATASPLDSGGPTFAAVDDVMFEEPAEPVGAVRILAELEARQAEEAERAAQEQQEAAWDEVWAETEYEPAWEDYGAYGGSGYDNDFMSQGVVYGDDGTRYTWYSSNAAYHYRTPEWTPDEDGFYRDSDGYYVVASDDHAQGEVVETPWGEGKVYDSGCDSGTVDMYTAF